MVLAYMKASATAELSLTMPLVGAHRVKRNNLDADAAIVDDEFTAEMDRLSASFFSTHREGVFAAYRFQQPVHLNGPRAAAGRAPSASTAPRTSAATPSTAPEIVDEAEVGALFERGGAEAGTIWQIFRIYESVGKEGTNTIAIAYFEVELARADGRDLDYFLDLDPDLERSNFESLNHEYLEVGSYGQVMDWIKKSDLPDPNPPTGNPEDTKGLRRSGRVVPEKEAPPTPRPAKRRKPNRPSKAKMMPWKDHPEGGAWSEVCLQCSCDLKDDEEDKGSWLDCYYCEASQHESCTLLHCPGTHPDVKGAWICPSCWEDYQSRNLEDGMYLVEKIMEGPREVDGHYKIKWVGHARCPLSLLPLQCFRLFAVCFYDAATRCCFPTNRAVIFLFPVQSYVGASW